MNKTSLAALATTNNERRMTNNEQRTTNNEQQTTNNKQRTTNNDDDDDDINKAANRHQQTDTSLPRLQQGRDQVEIQRCELRQGPFYAPQESGAERAVTPQPQPQHIHDLTSQNHEEA